MLIRKTHIDSWKWCENDSTHKMGHNSTTTVRLFFESCYIDIFQEEIPFKISQLQSVTKIY